MLHAVTPWLDEARRARAATPCAMGPNAPTRSTSARRSIVPLIAQQRLLGFLYADIDGAFGRFHDTDRDLMTMLAAQAAVALDNAQWAQELERKVDERTDELTRSLERQTATAEILKVISESPTDVQPVFRAIVHTAVRLLSCDSAGFMRCNGKTFSPVVGALRDGTPMRMEHSDTPVDPDANFPSRVIVTKTMLHVPDWSAVDLPEQQQGVYDRLGVRSSLMLPLLRADECIGVLALGRVKAGAFTDAEIALAKSFVDQALIAVENVRLFNETQEALGRQTATADILRVISSSPTDVQPVFDAIVQHSAATPGLRFGRRDAVRWQYVLAGRGRAPGWHAHRNGAIPSRRGPRREFSFAGHRRQSILHLPDWSAIDLPEHERRIEESHGVARRSCCRCCARASASACWPWYARRSAPSADTEIALAKSFVDQALIAIENVRLFNETKEALEQQTATAEVLQVISSSVADTAPVFDKILDSCQHLFASEQLGIIPRR